jgi:hypothetical protein
LEKWEEERETFLFSMQVMGKKTPTFSFIGLKFCMLFLGMSFFLDKVVRT